MKLLILRLEGALQSWGERSHWDHRDTAAFPSKSGVVGLLGCAMGLERGDARLAELADTLAFAVRADRRGTVMTDYHTVQSRRGKFLNTQGKPRGDTIVTPREYLEDACFTAFLAGPVDVLLACADALRSPVWVPCIARSKTRSECGRAATSRWTLPATATLRAASACCMKRGDIHVPDLRGHRPQASQRPAGA